MSAQGFLLAHGEKLLVALVLVICALLFYGTLTDEETQSEATLAEINEVVTKLETAYQNPGRPNLAETRDFEAEIKRRFQLEVDSQPVIAFLTGHFGVIKVPKEGDTSAYAYEVAVPELRVTDAIGSIEIRVEVEDGPRADEPDQYIADGPEAGPWSRPEPGQGQVTNHARWAGVLVEYRIFRNDGNQGVNDDWKPIVSPDAPGGVVPLRNGTGDAVMSDIDAWQTYDLRARLVVAATGTVDPTSGYSIGNEIVVLRRPLPVRDAPTTWPEAQERIKQPFLAGELEKYLADPYTGPAPRMPRAGMAGGARPAPAQPGGLPPGMGGPEGAPAQPAAGVNLAQLDYRYFVGSASPIESFVAKSATYLGLNRVSSGLGGGEDQAEIIIKRKVFTEEGEPVGWTPAQKFKYTKGEAVGEDGVVLDEPLPDPVPYDLSTPFTIKEIESDIERTLYWEVRERRAQDENGDWQTLLEVNPKTKNTQAVILGGPSELRLLRFEIIRPPLAGRYTFPAIPEGGINESEVFKQAPEAWKTPDLIPDEPIQHDNKDLIRQLVGARKSQLVVLPYVEMPDGRVYYYYPPTKKVEQAVIPGSDWEKFGGPKPLVDQTPKQPAGGGDRPREDDMPPDMPPEGFGPEGFDPEMFEGEE